MNYKDASRMSAAKLMCNSHTRQSSIHVLYINLPSAKCTERIEVQIFLLGLWLGESAGLLYQLGP